jgi:hypothetical protein
MAFVTLELKIEDLGTYDPYTGRRQAVVHEKILGTDDEGRKYGPMPGFAAESFCRVRRARFAQLMRQNNGVRIFLDS